jgi:hypothetical protein
MSGHATWNEKDVCSSEMKKWPFLVCIITSRAIFSVRPPSRLAGSLTTPTASQAWVNADLGNMWRAEKALSVIVIVGNERFFISPLHMCVSSPE